LEFLANAVKLVEREKNSPHRACEAEFGGNITRLFAIAAVGVASIPSIALASMPVPVPLAGTLGPAGLVVAGAAYVGYRIWKNRQN